MHKNSRVKSDNDLISASLAAFSFARKERHVPRTNPEPIKLQCRISDHIDILFILSGGFVVVEGEAFARPAQEEPQTAEENEKLQHTVNDGVGLPVLRDPLRRETVGTPVDPFRVERREGEGEREEKEEQQQRDVREHDALAPAAGVCQSEKHFFRCHHDPHEFVVREEDEGIEGEEADEREADQRCESFANIDAADHVHHEEEEEQA